MRATSGKTAARPLPAHRVVPEGKMTAHAKSATDSARTPSLLEENAQLPLHQIANVESNDRVVRFEYNVDDVH
jgi:uncharacterized protein (UPF0248 family)